MSYTYVCSLISHTWKNIYAGSDTSLNFSIFKGYFERQWKFSINLQNYVPGFLSITHDMWK